MTVKEYLGQYRRLKTDIDGKIEQVKELRGLAESVSHSFGTGGFTGVSDRVGKTVAKIVDMNNEISRRIDRLLELKNEIESVIAQVEEPMLRQLLTLRYINGREWERIALDMGYECRQVYRLHSRALASVKNVIECQSVCVL